MVIGGGGGGGGVCGAATRGGDWWRVIGADEGGCVPRGGVHCRGGGRQARRSGLTIDRQLH